MTAFSPSSLPPLMVLQVGFAFASSSSENGDDESDTDVATTTDSEENGDSDDEQEEDNQQQQQQQDVQEEDTEEEQDGEEQQQQFATVVGEICDDFEDNDGDGLIDLADVEDCAAPLTQGAITAPTTPLPPPPSVTDTTATNSTNNTLTAAGITTTDTDYVTYPEGIEVNDIDIECQTYEELGLDPPLPSPGDPPNLVWFDCSGVSIPVVPTGSTTTTTPNSGTGGGQGLAQGGQGQGQQPPSSAAPTTPTTSQGVEQGPVTTDNPDGSKTTTYPGGRIKTVYPWPDGRIITTYPGGTIEIIDRGASTTTTINSDGSSLTNNADHSITWTNPDGSWHTTSHPRQCVTITYFSDGRVQTLAGEPIIGTPTCTEAEERTEFPDGREMIRHYDGAFMVKYPDGSKAFTPAGAWRPNLW